MKSAESKTTATEAKKGTPFFNKRGVQNFAQSGHRDGPFFGKRASPQGTIQAKLTIGKPGDIYEKEADHMANQVVQRLNTPIQAKPVSPAAPHAPAATHTPASPLGPITPVRSAGAVQEKCAACEKEEEQLQEKEEAPGNTPIQRKPIFESKGEPPDETIQGKQADRSAASSPDLEKRLASSKGGGQQLPDGVRSSMEGAFGADFSGVRVHTGSDAQKMSHELGAQAFTTGNNIYFGSGKLNTSSKEGKNLLAHELTHTIQQGASGRAKPVQRRAEPVQQTAQDTSPATQISGAPKRGGLVQRGILDSVAGALGAAWDATGGKVVDAAGKVIEMGEDFFWSLLEKASPTIAGIIRKISQVGIVEFLKDEIKGAVGHIFDGLQNASGILGQISPTFANLLVQAKNIITALASGDCKPLFAALNQLKTALSDVAGALWSKITAFFAPIGDFFEGIWQSIGAPFIDWIKKTAGDVWNNIEQIAKDLWDDTAVIRNALAKAWDWIKGKLGLNADETGEQGLIQWIEQKASEAWEVLKAEMEPIVAPIRAMVGYVRQFIPLDAILHLRETIDGWLDQAIALGNTMGDDGKGVGAEQQQISLRDQILPAITSFIEKVRLGLVDAGGWVAEKIGSIGNSVQSFFNTLAGIPLLSSFSGVIDWVRDEVGKLVEWAQTTVQKLFTALGDTMVYLSKFIRPIFDLLKKIVGVLGDLLGKLPDLIMGPVWWALPDCIKDPIKNFFLEQILGRLPFFKNLKALGEIWDKLENAALTALKQVFVDGNLMGAIWTFYKTILDILKIPPKLVAGIISKGAKVLKDILNAPLDFLGNFLKALKGGFSRFFSNIGSHLVSGLASWLTGKLEGTSVKLPKDFSLKEIFAFVCSVLGITLDKILDKIEKASGKPGLKAKIQKAIAVGSKVLGWIGDLVKDGPAGIWDNLASQVGNLWDMILDGVAGWIEKNIVIQAIKWVAEKLDPTGITAIVTSIIDFFNVLQGIADQARQILEIVDHVIDGIDDIIKGIIDKAAAYIENVLGDAIPVVLNLLGYLFGMPDVAGEVQEVVHSLQEKVDSAIDWLIQKAKELIAGLFGAAGQDDDKKDGVAAALAEIDKEGSEKVETGEIPRADADQIAEDVKRDHPDAFASITVMDGGDTWNYEYVQKATEKIPKVKRPITTLKSAVPVYTGADGPMVKPLTSKITLGNEDTFDIPAWDFAQKLNMAKAPDKQGKGGDWVKGHKISWRFGGDGKNPDNIFIIDKSANGNMGVAEKAVRTALDDLKNLKDKNDPNYNKVMYYKVQFTTHGTDERLSAFGNTINIAWGTANADGTGEQQTGAKGVTSQKPPENAADVKYKVNNTGWETFYNLTKDKGIMTRFALNLMTIREKKGKYTSKDDISQKLLAYHGSDISDDTVTSQLQVLNSLIDDNLDLVITDNKNG